jgi:PAS domain-containing protein
VKKGLENKENNSSNRYSAFVMPTLWRIFTLLTTMPTQPALDTDMQIDFRATADALAQIAWTARPDGYIDHYNQAWYDYTGFDERYGNDSWLPLLHPDDVERCIAAMTHSVQTGTPYEIDTA